MAETPGPKGPVLPRPPEPFVEDPRKSLEAILKKLERLEEAASATEKGKDRLLVSSGCPPPKDRPIVTIAIQQAPRLVVALPGAAMIALQAVNRVPPAGGVLHWNLPNPAGTVAIHGVANQTVFHVHPVAAGAETIDLSHSYAGQQVHDTLLLEVVDVVINQGAELHVPLAARGANPTQFNLSATGTPAGGVFRWRIRDRQIIWFQNGPPGNQQLIQLEALDSGGTAVDLTYSYGGVTVRQYINVDVIGVRITEAPLVARQFQNVGDLVQVHVTANPVGGVMTWNLSDPCICFQHAAVPGPTARAATLSVATAGLCLLDVTYTFAGITVADQLEVVFVQVQLLAAAAGVLMHAVGANFNQVAMQANGIPANGVYVWEFRANGRIRFLNAARPVNSAAATFETQAPGNTSVEVNYTSHGVTVHEYAAVNVVAVTIAPNPVVMAMHQGANPNPVNLTATGVPANGHYAWGGNNNLIADFANVPGNNAAAVIGSRGPGSTQVNVAYTVGLQTANATAPVHVVDVQIQGPRLIRIPLPAVGVVTQIPLQANEAPPHGAFTAWRFGTVNLLALNGPLQANVNLDTLAAAGRTTVSVDYQFSGLTVTDTITIEVVSVTLAAAPVARLMHDAGALPNRSRITATVLPNGTPGVFAWNIVNLGVYRPLNNVALGNTISIDVETVGPGTTAVDLTFTPAGCAAINATIDIHCVAVTIVQAPLLSMLLNTVPVGPMGGPLPVPPVSRQLHADGVPPGGVHNWRAIPAAAGVMRYAGGAATVPNNQNANVEGLLVGLKTLTVEYVHHGLTATAAVDVQVTDYSCSCVNWGVPNAANVTAVALQDCPHGPAAALGQRPQSGLSLTVNPPYPHHHGTQCAYCQHQGLDVFHYINEQGPAIAELVILRNEIRHLGGLIQAHGNAHPNVAAYRLPRSWLNNLPADQFIPGGGASKMIGVLLGVRNGQPWKLRAVSGSFPGVGGGGPLFGAVNNYWARKLQNRGSIFSASRGVGNYNLAVQDGKFGRCAATHLLSQALHLRLQVTSMAEMWIGATMGAKVDGRLVASCDACRAYLNHMLCDRGGNARGNPYGAFAPPNRGF